MRFSNTSVILVDNVFEMDQFIDGQLNFMTAEADLYRIESFFESNGYRIKIELNRKVSATSRSKIESNQNQFDLTALVRGAGGLVSLGRVDEIFAAVGEQVLLGRVEVLGSELAGVDVHPVLALLGEAGVEGDDVVGDGVGHVLGKLPLLGPVLVQSGHEVGQRAGHSELDLKVAGGENQGVRVGDWDEAKEAGGLGGAPLAGRAVGEGYHDRLEVLADDLEFAHAFELHRLAG